MEQLPTVIESAGALASATAAAGIKAKIEARTIVALKYPRNIDQVRQEVLNDCRRLRLAEQAIYRKPIGKGSVEGASIRLLEAIKIRYKNIDVLVTLTFDSEELIKIDVTCSDLEANNHESEEFTVRKHVERRNATGREVIGERSNTAGDKVFIVKATEDELKNKINAQKSIVIRNLLRRLIPGDLIDEAMDECRKTMKAGSGDPDADRKRMCDGFAAIGVQPLDLEVYLGHPLSQVSPKEVADLRVVYQSIKDGEATWADYTGKEDDTRRGVLKPEDFKPTTKEPEKTPSEQPGIFPQPSLLEDVWFQVTGGMSDKARAAAEKMTFKFYKVKSIADIESGPDDFRAWLEAEVVPELEKQGLVG